MTTRRTITALAALILVGIFPTTGPALAVEPDAVSGAISFDNTLLPLPVNPNSPCPFGQGSTLDFEFDEVDVDEWEWMATGALIYDLEYPASSGIWYRFTFIFEIPSAPLVSSGTLSPYATSPPSWAMEGTFWLDISVEEISSGNCSSALICRMLAAAGLIPYSATHVGELPPPDGMSYISASSLNGEGINPVVIGQCDTNIHVLVSDAILHFVLILGW